MINRRPGGYRHGMTEMEREGHPQDPAEGPDEERGQGEDQRQEQAQQNQERELNDGDDVVQPGGQEPPD
jgi:hypothetical protein